MFLAVPLQKSNLSHYSLAVSKVYVFRVKHVSHHSLHTVPSRTSDISIISIWMRNDAQLWLRLRPSNNALPITLCPCADVDPHLVPLGQFQFSNDIPVWTSLDGNRQQIIKWTATCSGNRKLIFYLSKWPLTRKDPGMHRFLCKGWEYCLVKKV